MPASFGTGLTRRLPYHYEFEQKLDFIDALVAFLAKEGRDVHYFEPIEDEWWEVRVDGDEFEVKEVEIENLSVHTDVPRGIMCRLEFYHEIHAYLPFKSKHFMGSVDFHHEFPDVPSPYRIESIHNLRALTQDSRSNYTDTGELEWYDEILNAYDRAEKLRLSLVAYP